MELKKSYLFYLSIGSGLLLGLSWVPHFTALIFVALIPFFVMESLVLNSDLKKKKRSLFWLAWLTFFVWNLFDTWWVCYASVGGAALAIIANSLVMAFVYWLYLISTHRIKSNYKILLFIPFWITFEYLHTDWDLSWTWLTLGNVFAFKTSWVQWYEYTGVSGGSLWVLLVNALGFLSVMEFKSFGALRKAILIISIIILIFAPTQISEYVLEHYLTHSPSTQTVKGRTTVNVVVVQPSIDAYVEKFHVPFPDQFNDMLDLVRNKIDSTTDYLILPETFILSNDTTRDLDLYENNFGGHPYLQLFYDSLFSKHPRLTVVTGADTYYIYDNDEPHLPTARKYSGSNNYYECFNTALQLGVERPIDVYHKSKLVPGVEMMPFPKVFGLLGSLAIDMGGTTGSLGRQEEREVFEGPRGAKVGPIICFESAFGEFVTEYVKKGANVLFIITNDGWWDNTPGHKQHLAYATLRAIETRRYIARSANTGISCVIDDTGEIHKRAEWFEKAAIKYTIPLIDWKTFYVMHGDYIARTLRWLALITFIFGIYLWIRDKKNAKNEIQNKEKEKIRMRGIERMKK